MKKNTRSSIEACNIADIASIVAEFPEADDEPKKLPIKKLQMSFDDLAKPPTTSNNNVLLDNNCMKVYVRVRPLEKGKEGTIRIISENAIVTTAPEASRRAQYTKTEERHYTFHTVFGPEKDQMEIFDSIMMPLVDKFLSGQSCVLFAYGMSNAGKTFTIEGTAATPGMLPLLANKLLERLSKQPQLQTQSQSQSQTLPSSELKLSMLQIYNEKMTDLLHGKKKVTIRDRNGEVDVGDLTYHNIATPKDANKLITKGLKNRSSGFTVVNNTSSRSHGVYAFNIGNDSFYIIDLAGAERNNRTGTSGAQLKEAAEINKSLSLLWRCLNGVKKRNNLSNDPVPFRESKLTHLLMPVLMRTGTSGTSMITCINPKGEDYDETLSILANSSMAHEIREIPKIGRIVANGTSSTSAGVGSGAGAGAGTGAGGAAPLHSTNSFRGSVATGDKLRVRSSNLIDKPPNSSKKRDASCLSRKFSQESVDTLLSSSAAGTGMGMGSESSDGSIDYKLQITILNERILQLEQENNLIQVDQFEKERLIREEVCNEMTERSSNLLQQIRSLQDELYHLKNYSHDDPHKSVKKAKRMYDLLTRDQVTSELRETEEEMEIIKLNYEKEIKSLKNEVRNLKAELADWRRKAESAMKIISQTKERGGLHVVGVGNSDHTAHVQHTSTSTGVGTSGVGGTSGVVREGLVNNENDDSNYQSTIAETFDERMQRDQRFNRHKKLAELSPKLNSSANGVVREPLSAVSPNASPPGEVDENISNDSLSINKFSQKILTSHGRSPPPSPHRSSDALPIAPPQSDIKLNSAPFVPNRVLRSQIRMT